MVNGRNHNHYGFSLWMAGGGIKGGITHGATDDFAYKAVVAPALARAPVRYGRGGHP